MRVPTRYFIPLLISLLVSWGCGNKPEQREVRDGDPNLAKDNKATAPPRGKKDKMLIPPPPRDPPKLNPKQ
jgi:hypothetical protein